MSTQFSIIVGVVPGVAAEAGVLWVFEIIEYSVAEGGVAGGVGPAYSCIVVNSWYSILLNIPLFKKEMKSNIRILEVRHKSDY